MVAPVTGPFTDLRQWNGAAPFNTENLWGRRERTWRRQKKPYNLPLAYVLSDKRVLHYTSYGAKSGAFKNAFATDGVNTVYGSSSDAYSKAYGDFREKLSKGAAWGITLAQRKQAMVMMESRLVQFYRFVKHMKKFRFKDALGELGVKATDERIPWKRLKKRSKALGDNIIEVRFGWQPLISDISTTAEILGSPIPLGRIVGKGTTRIKSSRTLGPSSVPPGYYSNKYVYQDYTLVRCRVQGDVVMTNPNTALLNNLGLLNPALVLYDAIPWSFVANYFINLEEFLTGFSSFIGYSVTNTFVTYKQTSFTDARRDEVRAPSYAPTGQACVYGVYCTYVNRTPQALTGPKLRVRDPWSLKPGRALNIVGLLLQQLGRK